MVIDTADLFYRRGYESASVNDISAALGIVKRGLYYYIESKEDLVYVAGGIYGSSTVFVNVRPVATSGRAALTSPSVTGMSSYDEPTRSIIEFATSARCDSLSESCVHAVVRNLVDAMGCAAGGFEAEPSRIARRLAASTSGSPAVSVFGSARLALIEHAVFANTAMVRHLDYNDVLLMGGHPSDMSPAILAMAEAYGGAGRDVVTAIYVAYEVFAAIASAPVRPRGWDQGVVCSPGVAAGLGNLLRLPADQLANAVSIALTPSIPLRVVRAGELSMWKGCATAAAAMTATFATRLAMDGMTGPPDVFAGVDALFKQVTGPFELGQIGARELGASAPELTQHKYYPTEANSQSSLYAILQLRSRFRPEEVEAVHISTYYLAWHEIGGGQGDAEEKWDPRTRETADHSLPYIVAVGLIDGGVTLDSFSLARISDPGLRPLMRKITIVEDPGMTARFESEGELGSHVQVTLRDGRTLEERATFPRGHHRNPMTDQELDQKFDTMVSAVLPAAEQRELRDRLWNLPDQPDIGRIAELMRRFATRNGAV